MPDTDDARGSLALALYALAAARTLRRPCRRVELHHLPTGRVAAWEHTEESLARHVGRAVGHRRRHRARGRRGGGRRRRRRGVPAGDRAAVRLVRLPAHCPAGQAASTEQPPWSGLAEPVTAPAGADPAQD